MRLLQTSLLLLLTIASACSIQEESTALFPIVRDGRWGFINVHGKEVIKPVFRGVGRFSDSLAPARLNGTWGFINRKGVFVVAPVYDYATEFSEGFARVWHNGKPSFIDLNGQNPFVLPDSTFSIKDFKKGRAEINYVEDGKWRDVWLRQNGTIEPYEKMDYHEGLRIVEREIFNKTRGNDETQYAVKDSSGNLIVPFGKYDGIEPFHEGFAAVTIDSGWLQDERLGFIRKDGTLAFMLPKGSYTSDNYFSEGLVAIETRLYPESNRFAYWEEYIIWYDTAGKQVLVMDDYYNAEPLVHNRTIVGISRKQCLTDRYGRQMGKNWFVSFVDYDFSDNMAIVEALPENSEARPIYGVIDSMGEYIIKPKFNSVHVDGFQAEGLLVAVEEPLTAEHDKPRYKPIKKHWGLIDTKGDWVIKPKFTAIAQNGYQDGLMYAEIDSLYGYVNAQGKFVWSAVRTTKPSSLDWYNIDFKRPAIYRGNDEPVEFERDDRPHSNLIQHGATALGFPDNQLVFFIDTLKEYAYEHAFHGYKAYLVNTTKDTLPIESVGYNLNIMAEARNPAGQWQGIEESMQYGCGNNFFDVQFHPNSFWAFDIPRYDGDFETTLRLVFSYNRKWDGETAIYKKVYSNAVTVRLNPAQFWRTEMPFWDLELLKTYARG